MGPECPPLLLVNILFKRYENASMGLRRYRANMQLKAKLDYL